MKVKELGNCCELIGGSGNTWERYCSLQEAMVNTQPDGVRDHLGHKFQRPRGSRLHYGLYHPVLGKSWTEIMQHPFPAGLRKKISCSVCHELGGHCKGSPSRWPHDCHVSLGNALCVHQEDAHLLTTAERLVLIGKANGWIEPAAANKVLAEALVYTDTGNRIDGIAVRANDFLGKKEESSGSFFLDVLREPYIFSPQVVNLISSTGLSLQNFDTKDQFRDMIKPLQNAFGNLVSSCLDSAQELLMEMGENNLKEKPLKAGDICSHFDTHNFGKLVRHLYYDAGRG